MQDDLTDVLAPNKSLLYADRIYGMHVVMSANSVETMLVTECVGMSKGVKLRPTHKGNARSYIAMIINQHVVVNYPIDIQANYWSKQPKQ